MQKRAPQFVSAAILSFFAGTAFAAPPDTATPASKAGEECLAAPKSTTPAGGHWYYRTDRATKRKCWYLGEAGMKVKKAAAPKPAPAPQPQATDADEPSITGSTADARAELPPARADAPDRHVMPSAPPPQTPLAETASPNAAATPDSAPWPDSQPVQLADAEPDSIPGGQDAATTETIPAASTMPESLPDDPAGIQPTEPPQTAATAPMLASEPTTGPLRLFLGVLVIALGFAVIIGRLIFLYIGKRRIVRVDRRDLWARAAPDEQAPPPPAFARMSAPPVRMRTGSESAPPEDDIEALLRRVSRRATR